MFYLFYASKRAPVPLFCFSLFRFVGFPLLLAIALLILLLSHCFIGYGRFIKLQWGCLMQHFKGRLKVKMRSDISAVYCYRTVEHGDRATPSLDGRLLLGFKLNFRPRAAALRFQNFSMASMSPVQNKCFMPEGEVARAVFVALLF